MEQDQIRAFEHKFSEQVEQGDVKTQTAFEFALALASSDHKNDLENSITLLKKLQENDPGSARIYLFYIASAYYKLKEYKHARHHIDKLLEMEPKNHQALKLKKEIESELTTDGMIGAALVGGAIATIGIVAAALLSRK